MTFNSLSYFIFLLVIYLLFYLISDRRRWLLLLIASYGFYATLRAPYLLAVLLMVTAISYACGLRMTSNQDEAIRKRWLWIGTSTCVAILALLKYLPFLEAKTNTILGLKSTTSSTLISIGVSYFTFQAISYLSDIYLEIEEPERHFGIYALYMAFFPKLLQGPIERAGDLLPQLKQPYKFDYDTMRSGMLLFTWGLFKKVVVADRLAPYADQIYNNVHDYKGLPLIVGTYAYALQIYFDFSGYTDMARGAGSIFGISLSENFRSPYLATSIAEFWRRWHISFSRWILDYIFRPLQMTWRKWGQKGTAAALILTFAISGIWHGASSGFVIWGLLHGIYLAASTYYRPYQKSIYKWLRLDKKQWPDWWKVFITFNLTSFAWIYFRAISVNDALYVTNNILSFKNLINRSISDIIAKDILLEKGGINAFIIVSLLIMLSIIHQRGWKQSTLYNLNTTMRWFCYLLILLLLSLFSYPSTYNFIYYQF